MCEYCCRRWADMKTQFHTLVLLWLDSTRRPIGQGSRKFCPPWHGPNTCENVYTLCICCMLTRGSVPARESKRVERKIKVLHSSKQWPKYRYRGNSPRAGSLAGEQLTEIHHVWIHSLRTQCFTIQHVILQRQLALKTFFYLCSWQSRREKGLM